MKNLEDSIKLERDTLNIKHSKHIYKMENSFKIKWKTWFLICWDHPKLNLQKILIAHVQTIIPWNILQFLKGSVALQIICLASLIGVGSRVPRDFHFHRNNGDAGTIAYIRGHMSHTNTHVRMLLWRFAFLS